MEDAVVPKELLSRLADILRLHMGLYFPRKNWNSLKGKLFAAMRDFDFEDAGEFVQWLSSAPLTKGHIELLASHITTGETYFFREKNLFSALENRLLPDLIQARQAAGKQIRIWSAGCATGEEPYSIAILLRKLIPDYSSWNISILATDINPRFLQKARGGIYSKWSFRNTPSWVVDEYFRNLEDGLSMILPHIKQMVQFSYLNLAEDVYPSLLNNTNATDMIFCRNVLMYFAPEYMQPVVDRIYRSLVNGGILIVGPVETSQVITPQFIPERYDGMVFHRKHSGTSMPYRKAPEITQNHTEPRVVHFKEMIPQKDPRTARVAEKTKLSIPRRKRTMQVIAKDIPEKSPYDAALNLYTHGRYLEAEDKLTNLWKADHHNPKALILMARAHANQGNLDTALNWCEKAIDEDKLNPVSYYLRALILEEQGKDAEALESLRGVLYLDPSFALAHFSLGNLAFKQGRQDEGERHFMNTLDLLSRLKPDGVINESEGITAKRLAEIISSISSQHSEGPGHDGGGIAGALNKLQQSRAQGLHSEIPL